MSETARLHDAEARGLVVLAAAAFGMGTVGLVALSWWVQAVLGVTA